MQMNALKMGKAALVVITWIIGMGAMSCEARVLSSSSSPTTSDTSSTTTEDCKTNNACITGTTSATTKVTSGKSKEMQEVTEAKRLGGMRDEIQAKYNELEDYVSRRLKPNECAELIRLLYCNGFPIAGPDSNIMCAPDTSEKDDEGIRIENERDCKHHLQAWAKAVTETLGSSDSNNSLLRMYLMGWNHWRRSLKDGPLNLIANLNRAREVLRRHSINILVRGAVQPVVEHEESAAWVVPAGSKPEELSSQRARYFAVLSRRQPRAWEKQIGPFSERKWSPNLRRHNVTSRSRKLRVRPLRIDIRRAASTSSSSSARPLRLHEYSLMEVKEENVPGDYGEDVGLRAHRFFTLLAPLILLTSMTTFLLWLCCNFRRFYSQQPPSQYSYNFKYSAVPEHEKKAQSSSHHQQRPVQGFVGSFNSDPHRQLLLQHI